MASLLSASKFPELGLICAGSSHFTFLDENATSIKYRTSYKRDSEVAAAKERCYKVLPANSKVRAWGGLVLAGVQFPKHPRDLQPLKKKERFRKDQCDEFKQFISSTTRKVALHESGTNDWKFFLVLEDGSLIQLSLLASEVWARLAERDKIYFSPKRHRVVSSENQQLIRLNVLKYVELIKDLYKESVVEFVFVSSLIERTHVCFENLEIYFALINYLLGVEITKLNKGSGIFNRNSKLIQWQFINVSGQFFKAKNRKLIFRESSNDLIHRSIPCMCDIFDIYLQDIHKTLAAKKLI